MFKDLKIAVLLLSVAVFPSASALTGCSSKCPEGQECKAKDTGNSSTTGSATPQPCLPGGTAGVSGGGSGGASGGEGGTLSPDAAVSQVECVNRKCLNAAAQPPCSVFAGCDIDSNKCKIVQAAAGAGQCMDGDKRHCSTPTVPQGIYYCNTSLCDYKTVDCLACGEKDQPCCVGGCKKGFFCSDMSNATKDSGKCVANGGTGG